MKWKSLNFEALPNYNRSSDRLLLLLRILGFSVLHLHVQRSASSNAEFCIFTFKVLHLRVQRSASSSADFCIFERRLLHLRKRIRAILHAGSGNLLLKAARTYLTDGLTSFANR